MDPTLRQGQVVTFTATTTCCHHGDVILFQAPPLVSGNGITDLVMRVIALPGETVTYSAGGILINGARPTETYLSSGTITEIEGDAVPPNCGAPTNGQPGCVVPAGRVFVLGDNRAASKDSRTYGPIQLRAVRGIRTG
jgi:signal peptidase I